MASLIAKRHNEGMEKTGKELQALIDARLDEIEMSRAKAQKKAGLGQTYIRDLARGGSPDVRKISKLAKAIGLSPVELLGIEDPLVVERPGIPKTDSAADFFSEDEIRQAVLVALQLGANRDPNFIADLTISVLKSQALGVSISLSRA